VLFVLHQLGWWPLHFTITAGVVVAFSAVIFIVLSRLKSPPAEEVVARFTYQKQLIHQDNQSLPWYQNYLFWAALLMGAILALFVVLM